MINLENEVGKESIGFGKVLKHIFVPFYTTNKVESEGSNGDATSGMLPGILYAFDTVRIVGYAQGLNEIVGAISGRKIW